MLSWHQLFAELTMTIPFRIIYDQSNQSSLIIVLLIQYIISLLVDYNPTLLRNEVIKIIFLPIFLSFLISTLIFIHLVSL